MDELSVLVYPEMECHSTRRIVDVGQIHPRINRERLEFILVNKTASGEL